MAFSHVVSDCLVKVICSQFHAGEQGAGGQLVQVQLGGAAQDDHCAVVSPGSGQQAEQRQYGGDGEDGEVVS